jgi:hypothetical protein
LCVLTALYRMKGFLDMNIVHIAIGAVIGGALGFAYYKTVGCTTGACPLTSNPFVSTIYGICIGGLIASTFR